MGDGSGGCVATVVSGDTEKNVLVTRCDMLSYLYLFSCRTLFFFSPFSLKPPASFPRLYPHTPPPRPVENDNTLRIKNEKTRSLLLFTNVTEKHFGNYTCFASNRLGASNASMLLFRK